MAIRRNACSLLALPDFPEFAQAVRYGVPRTLPIKAILSPWPVERPVDWTDRVNAPLSVKELGRVRVSIERGRPFGEDEWVKRTASELRLEHTIRPEGRPPKPRN